MEVDDKSNENTARTYLEGENSLRMKILLTMRVKIVWE